MLSERNLQHLLNMGQLMSHIYDLAELYYVGELRTELACHISYRRVVERMVNLAKAHHPNLLKHVRVVPTTVEGAHS